jgi:hypothetical protein
MTFVGALEVRAGAWPSRISQAVSLLLPNSPAQWAFAQACTGQVYTIEDIRDLLARDAIPFALATKGAEKSQMKYKCTIPAPDNVNNCGWKLCHIDKVGLSTRRSLAEIPITDLLRHFRLLMSPSNHFIVPLLGRAR